MSLQAFLEWFTQASIVLLAILMVVQWTRWRDRVSLDIFLVFGSLAILLILERAASPHGHSGRVDPSAGHQRPARAPLSAAARRLALPARLANCAARGRRQGSSCRSLRRGRRPGRSARPRSSFPRFVYFLWLLGYVAWAFRQGARAAGGVTHWRMQHAALGALLLAIVFVLAVLIAALPVSRTRRLRSFRWPRSGRL